MPKFEGKAFVFGNNINTDYIISSRRKRDTLDLNVLKVYFMEDIRPGFYDELEGVSILVAGENFGCGSAMEVAAQIIPANNIPVILAKSFARSYFRNCINNGVLPVEMDTSGISEGQRICVAMESGKVSVLNVDTGASTQLAGPDGEVLKILESGGIVHYVRSQIKNKSGG